MKEKLLVKLPESSADIQPQPPPTEGPQPEPEPERLGSEPEPESERLGPEPERPEQEPERLGSEPERPEPEPEVVQAGRRIAQASLDSSDSTEDEEARTAGRFITPAGVEPAAALPHLSPPFPA
ncbi:hypothetical protein FJT64_024777 [Amphibalanus amphitrite]|uniref:Uncharacterized protein n=1 Tax=Amphibalanus amphitrite TaxID=1232801 RepID=A0A6A4WB54_AMPAM|nr:hypothetical protein FJT64_024777 [Amphibalanus amphitrite]